ncbi:winged helix-turn-helix domain-containing protein [Jeongeupia naejangsanensis]|uniref:Helix-turn-helix domain-containing protein n=1 Tax=Jeongeupia naejangsanensis TaxID=613195 RepID=A0ABS2BIE4_9NEIS|nr:helix-turn-helix domain-containing protein [Jeongeupia naejangsanensis]MBM3114863.1 helix-turn-helix domain-containing protein [Jeongeupia naejangsanensis]
MNFYVKEMQVSGSRLLFGSFEFQPELRYLTRRTQDRTDIRVRLSGAEARILSHLLDHPGRICSKDTLVAIGWEGKPVSASSLAVAISNLRRHVQTNPPEVEIHNQPRQGYLLTLLVELKAEFRTVEPDAQPSRYPDVSPAEPLLEQAAPLPETRVPPPVTAVASNARLRRWRTLNLLCLALLLVLVLVSFHEWIDVDCTEANGGWTCAVDSPATQASQVGPVLPGSVVLVAGRMVNVVYTNEQAQP